VRGTDSGVTQVETAHGVMRCVFAEPIVAGTKASVTARPEDIVLFAAADPPPDGLNVLKGKIVNRVFLGEVVDYVVDLGDGELRVRARSDDFQIGQPVTLSVAPGKCVGLAG
jgi:ABC-type Fe3+/spermidine/putrescine transport system ATPase subunit